MFGHNTNGVGSGCKAWPRDRSSFRPATEPTGVAVESTSPIRVLLADDHVVVRQGLVRLLQDQADIEVVGEATDGNEAVDLCRQVRPDVVIMDVNMPKANGLDATRQIASEAPEIRIIALTVYKSPDMEGLLLGAGAWAYLPKDGPFSVLIDRIRGHRGASKSDRLHP